MMPVSHKMVREGMLEVDILICNIIGHFQVHALTVGLVHKYCFPFHR